MSDPHTPENGRPCCNVTEPDGILCNGTERAGWPVFVCDTCGGNCGALAHEHHAVLDDWEQAPA